ncbi:hypothetical protein IWW48_003105 [Coemansia sp. RSA 1200]|nr:hypothetical protein IWW48_003105 [Coemansia sp. RSA 1200]
MGFDCMLPLLRDELGACIGVSDVSEIPWCWLTVAASKIMSEHSSGLSRTVLLTELEAKWHHESSREILHTDIHRTVGPFFHREPKPSQELVFGLEIDNTWTIPGTEIWLWTLSGAPDPAEVGGAVAGGSRRPKARNTADMQIDAFIHQRYYPIIEATEFSGFFSHRRTLYMTGLSAADRGGNGGGSPNQTILPTALLAFELRIKETKGLPAELRPFTDEPLLESIFGVRYSGERFVRHAQPAFNADQLWCKVDLVCPQETQYRNNRLAPYQVIQGLAEHEDPPRLVNISFWDKDIGVARLFKQDSYIGLLCPIMTSKPSEKTVEVEYGTQTIAFISQELSSAPNTLASQVSIAYNDLGYLDYRRYAHRMYLDRCRPGMVNLSLLVRVVAVSDNIPLVEGERRTERYALRVEDERGTCDLTLWSKVGQQASRLLPGQLILLESVETHEESGDVILNGSVDIDTRVYNISAMTGILTSSTLCTYVPLAWAQHPETTNSYCRARVVAITSSGAYVRDARDSLAATSLVHSVCGKPVVCSGISSDGGKQLENPVDFYSFDCPSCDIACLEADDIESVFVIALEINDGTTSARAHSTASAASEIVGISPARFLHLPNASEQQSALASAVGQEFVLSLSSYCEPLSAKISLRIDAARLSSDIGELSA